MRAVLVKLHMLGGFAAALFVVVLGLTGSIMAFEDELDHVTHPRLFSVTPVGTPKRLTELGAEVLAAYPGRKIGGYGMGVSPDLSYAVSIGGTAVFVNQYTGEILGERSGPTWLSQVHQLHLRLLAGSTGKTIVSWAGVLTLLLTISGLYLWWPVKRISVNWKAGGRRRWFDLHNTIGVLGFVFLFTLGLTGTIIGFESVTSPMLYGLTHSQPYPFAVPVTPKPGVQMVTPDDAVATARIAMPGAVPIAISAPNPKSAYRVAMRFPEDRTPGGRTRVFVDPYTAAVVLAESSRTTAAGTRVVNLNRAIHTGDVFGIPSKVVMSLTSVAAVAQVISGLAMWWKRRSRV
jgi:uncharacterized iron-regulated membrane protein